MPIYHIFFFWFIFLELFLNHFCLTCCFLFFITGPLEICKTEAIATFSPQCNPNQVVVLTHAMFGRMSLGECIKRDFGGYVGKCSADVLGVLEPLCSGRPSCSVDSQNPEFPHECPPDLKSYLEASYGCLPGETFTLILFMSLYK